MNSLTNPIFIGEDNTFDEVNGSNRAKLYIDS